MREFFRLLKGGTKSAFWAACVNTIVAIIKTIAYLITGNVAMFAEMMHSFGDAANQLFVFVGSALSKKAPTERFPGGFGRLVNLVLLGAVLVVGVLAYETIVEGIHHISDTTHSEDWFWLNISVLGASALLEAFVLQKAMREITEHLPAEKISGMKFVFQSYKHVKEAKPATKLVFLEDNVAVGGAVLALLAIVISTYTPFHSATGYASIIIGAMLILVVGRVFLDNAAGALGVADVKMQARIGAKVLQHEKVRDIQDLDVIKEGESFHIELKLEVDPKMTIAEADDVRDYIEKRIKEGVKGVTDVIIEFDEDDKIDTWRSLSKETPTS
ncbi:cation diffusion facilitator family transporter [Planomicrobium sp. CPCC 101079]|uniref:cation diffusion facilitator family transporter n=1 Tax=Planomicrobium sp. CPCC 101079 TaxID=2599618 RepID=UPI0011B5CA5C|nr:cation diffusion facilitator family transporter [Planomicrobium sp. CPCC 101079]TWT02387.1 cation diffusion facilitator family transporter [Planomicrobium sp. CPCC 101079]